MPTMLAIGVIILALMCASKAAAEECLDENAAWDGPHLLTNANCGPHYKLGIKTKDQCMLQPGQREFLEYALRIFKQHGLRCDDPKNALLICYEAQLENLYMNPSKAYQLEQDTNNTITNLCEAKRNESAIEFNRGIPWHGIRVHHNGNTIVVETSMHETPFVFSIDGLQFDIVLTTKENGRTEIIVPGVPGKRRTRVPSDSSDSSHLLGKEYAHSMYKAALINRYKHHWALGLDMLPPENEDELWLHVYRGCGCSMDAYFLSPPDDPKKLPIRPSVPPSFGSNNCLKREIDQTIDLPGDPIFGIDKIIQLKGLTDAHQPIQIEIRFLGEKNEPLMKAIINGTTAEMITGNKTTEMANAEFEEQMIKYRSNDGKDLVFTLALVAHKNEYDFKLEATIKDGSATENILIALSHWPENWWNGIPIGEIKKIKLNGNFILVQKPEYLDGVKKAHLQVPYYTKHAEMQENGRIVIKGEMAEDAEFFTTLLLHDAPEWHHYIGATVMKLHVDFTNGKIEVSTYVHGNRTFANPSEIIAQGNAFQRNEAFELQIDILEEAIKVSRNGERIVEYKHRMQIWNINWLRIEGNVGLLAEPIIDIPNVTHAGSEFSIELPSLLQTDDIIQIAGYVPPNAQFFQISLLHESPKFSEQVGDTIMRLDFNFSIDNFDSKLKKYRAYADYFNHKSQKFEGLKSSEDTNPIRKDYKIELEIKVTQNGFKVTDDFDNHDLIIEYNIGLPSWAVDHIWITGNVSVSCGPVIIGPSVPGLVENQCGTNTILPSAVNPLIKQVEEPLVPGDVIKINGNMSGQFELSLFSEALKYDKTIGKTVLGMKINGQNHSIQLFTYYNGSNAFLNTTSNPNLLTHMEMQIQIDVRTHEYNIAINGKNESKSFNFARQYAHFLPIWAVEYIVVEGDFAIDGNIKVEKAKLT